MDQNTPSPSHFFLSSFLFSWLLNTEKNKILWNLQNKLLTFSKTTHWVFTLILEWHLWELWHSWEWRNSSLHSRIELSYPPVNLSHFHKSVPCLSFSHCFVFLIVNCVFSSIIILLMIWKSVTIHHYKRNYRISWSIWCKVRWILLLPCFLWILL